MDSIIFSNTWDQHVGKIENLGLVSGTDTSLNYVGIAEESTQWNEEFTDEDYKELVNAIYEGKIQISDAIDQFPETEVEVDVREGTIK